MHKAIMKAMRTAYLAQSAPRNTTQSQKKIIALVSGTTDRTLQCPLQPARSYTVTASLHNTSNGKKFPDIEFLIDTGCQFAIVVPEFVADQLGLDESTLLQTHGIDNIDGGTFMAPTHRILITINGIPIQTTVTVSGTSGKRALIGAELLSLFDLEIRNDSCKLSLPALK